MIGSRLSKMSHEMVILSPESMSDRVGQVYTDSRTEKGGYR